MDTPHRTHPTVSICVPTYDGEAYLRPCLDSALAQTGVDAEVLVVDDGSSDGTREIVASYASRHPRLRWVANPRNLGLVGNWNRCVALARGEWIKFLFQDDILRPEATERLLATAREHGASLAFGRRDFIFEHGVDDPTRAWYERGAKEVETLFSETGRVPATEFQNLALAASNRNFMGEPVTVLFKRDLLARYGGFNPHLAVFCDMEFWLRVGVNEGVSALAATVASFRVHGNSTTARSQRSRAYRMNILDHVVVAHECAHHPAYAALRAAGSGQGPRLAKEFDAIARWAHGVARREAGAGDASALHEWQAVARHYPRLADTQRRQRVNALKTRISQAARGLAGRLSARDGTGTP